MGRELAIGQRRFGIPFTFVLLIAGASCAPPGDAQTSEAKREAQGAIPRPPVPDPMRLDQLVARNLDAAVSLPETLLANRIAAWRDLPIGERVGRWAKLFADRGDNVYCFGPKPGGYVAESLLVQDYKHDCVSLFYRCTELAQAPSPRDALAGALAYRFAGGDPERFLRPTGAVDYDDPSHLDYSEDILRGGRYGRDVTREVGEAVPERPGTSRYPADTFHYVPKQKLRYDRLQEGDLLYFVLNEANEKAAKLRHDYGLLVGHQGIVHRDGDTVYLIHAAQSDLAGVYTGNRVVQVPLRTYLERLDRFKGLLVGRL